MTLTLRRRPAEVDAEVASELPAPLPVRTPVRLPRVNLLPPELAERRRLRRVQLGLAGGVVGCLGLVGVLHVAAAGSVADATAELSASTATGARLSQEGARYATVTSVYAQAAAAKGVLTQAMGEEVLFSRLLSELSTSLPQGVWLEDVTVTQTPAAAAVPPGGAPAAAVPGSPSVGTVTFTGTGFAHDDVASWLEALDRSDSFADPYFSKSTEGVRAQRKTVSFSSTAALTPAALSRRYTAGG